MSGYDDPPMTLADIEGPGPEPPVPCPRIDTEGCDAWFWWQGSRAMVGHMRDEHGVTIPERDENGRERSGHYPVRVKAGDKYAAVQVMCIRCRVDWPCGEAA